MITRIMQFVGLACRHRNTSKPFVVSSRGPATADWEAIAPGHFSHYVVCFDCGQEFAYDWQQMRVINGSREGELIAPNVLPENAQSLAKVA